MEVINKVGKDNNNAIAVSGGPVAKGGSKIVSFAKNAFLGLAKVGPGVAEFFPLKALLENVAGQDGSIAIAAAASIATMAFTSEIVKKIIRDKGKEM